MSASRLFSFVPSVPFGVGGCPGRRSLARSVPSAGLRIEPRVSIRFTPRRRAREPFTRLDGAVPGSACGRCRRVCDPPTSSASAGPVAVNPSLPLCTRFLTVAAHRRPSHRILRGAAAPTMAPLSCRVSPAKSDSLESSRCEGRAFISARNMTCRRPGLRASQPSSSALTCRRCSPSWLPRRSQAALTLASSTRHDRRTCRNRRCRPTLRSDTEGSLEMLWCSAARSPRRMTCDVARVMAV